MKNRISLFSLIMLIVAAVASIRTLPSNAFFGSSLIFFYLMASLFFLLPISLISAEFSSRFSSEGGVFHWIRYAFGDRMGVLAVWLQWINTMVWYPTLLLFIASTASYLLSPVFSHHKFFLLVMSLVIFWGLTLLNLRGIQVSSKLNSLCGTIGTLLPMSILIILAILWSVSGKSLAISFSWSDLLPSVNLLEASSSLVAIMTSFLGMELAGVYVNEIAHPQKNFPKAIGIAVLILLTALIFGSLAIAVILPKHEIHFVDGVMQTFIVCLTRFKLAFLAPFFAFLIMVGGTGGSINWLLSPAHGLFQAAEKGFFPAFFLVKNRYGVSYRILVLQACVVSLFCFAIHFALNLNTYYWFLMALSTGLYMMVYVLLFLAALKLKRTDVGYQIPWGLRTISCISGLGAALVTMVVGFQPPPEMDIENRVLYVFLIIVGFCLTIMPVTLLWRYQKRATLRDRKEINATLRRG